MRIIHSSTLAESLQLLRDSILRGGGLHMPPRNAKTILPDWEHESTATHSATTQRILQLLGHNNIRWIA